MAVKTWVGGGGVEGTAGKWSEAKGWSPEGVPAATSDIQFKVGSGSLELAAAGKCRGIDFTNFVKTFTMKVGAALSIGTTTEALSGIALKFVAGMTLTAAAECVISFVSTSGKVEGLWGGGLTCPDLEIGTISGKPQVKLEEALKTAQIHHGEGTLDTNNQTVEVSETFESKLAAARTIKLGSSLIKLTGKATVLNFNAASLTLERGTSKIEITDSTNNVKFFEGGGYTFYDLICAGESNTAGNRVHIKQGNTFHSLALNNPNTGAQSGVELEGGATQTVEGEITTTAKSGKALKLIKDPVAGAAKLKKAATNVCLDWLEIKDVVTDEAVEWFAGVNSTLSGETKAWKKESCGATTAACKTKVTVKESATGLFNARASATATYSFAPHATVTVTNKAQAIARLTFLDAIAPVAIMQARASAKIVIAQNATAQQVQWAVGKARLVFSGEAHTSTGEGPLGRVAVFIFEEDE